MARVTVWFDGDCPLCLQEIALMQRLDRRELLARFHADENGHLLSGAAAFAAMWRAIPILRPFGLLARNPHVLGGLEHAYLAFLKVRPRLQLWARRREADRVRAV